MPRKTTKGLTPPHQSPFEQISRTNDSGNEYWSSRDFAKVLDYSDYLNFEQVIAKARTACFNSGQRIDDHFVDATDMIEVGKGAKGPAIAKEDDGSGQTHLLQKTKVSTIPKGNFQEGLR